MKRFRLMTIGAFDARRGYSRCETPGVGVRVGREPGAVADFWRDRTGNLVVRCSSQGYRLHLSATLADGSVVPPSEMPAFSDFLIDVLFNWLVEGVDDVPNCVAEFDDE